jgi:hypothetical protein
MVLTYTLHARRRMDQRDIAESDIEAVLRLPQKPRRDGDGNPIYAGMVDGRFIEVVIAAKSHPPRVITVWD